MNYLGKAFIQADRPLHFVADELNKVIEPLRLMETDRFDEVPGFIAELRPSLYVALQGIPNETDTEDYNEEPSYFLKVRFILKNESEIPAWIGNLSSSPLLPSGYSDISGALAQVLTAQTSLRLQA